MHGVGDLLVTDVASMPFVTLANTNLPTFAGAEKIARDLLSQESGVGIGVEPARPRHTASYYGTGVPETGPSGGRRRKIWTRRFPSSAT